MFTETTLNPAGVLAGNTDLAVGRKITVLSGQNLVAGAVLGKVTASGKYVLSLSASADGSQTPDLILAEDCDASGGDAVALAYSRGDFDENRLTIGTAHTADSIREGLRAKGIVLLPSISN